MADSKYVKMNLEYDPKIHGDYGIDSDGTVFAVGIAIEAEDLIPIELQPSKVIYVDGFDGPFIPGRIINDAQQALDTLPRVIRKLIYRYAKWRLR